MGLDVLQNVVGTIKENPLAAVAGAAVGGVALGVGGSAIVGAIVKRKTKRRKSKSSRKRSRSPKRRKTRRTKYARTAGKRKDTSKKRIRMTKNGQPYVILASGKARFISKRSAKLSRKRKGGRY